MRDVGEKRVTAYCEADCSQTKDSNNGAFLYLRSVPNSTKTCASNEGPNLVMIGAIAGQNAIDSPQDT
jgi:hypothetical protein